jgi:hypothetical protein
METSNEDTPPRRRDSAPKGGKTTDVQESGPSGLQEVPIFTPSRKARKNIIIEESDGEDDDFEQNQTKTTPVKDLAKVHQKERMILKKTGQRRH